MIFLKSHACETFLFKNFPLGLMRFQSYFNTAVSLIKLYDGKIPLVHFLKQYFSQHKKYGSKDRKFITHLCYCYYRIGYAAKQLSVEERLKIAIYLCNATAEDWHILFDENWNEWSNDINARIDCIQKKYPIFFIQDIFPWKDELSKTIDAKAFAASHLIQPDLFLRIRPHKEKIVKAKLEASQIPFQPITDTCLALPNTSKIDSIIDLDKEAVVQDYSSQQIKEFLQLITYNLQPTTQLWDCCAASGGKSILAKDVLQNIELTVSDVRSSILQNLKQRFEKAGIKKYNSFVADLSIVNGQWPMVNSQNKSEISNQKLDIILCDAPCSGSGTWGRTPEQLYFFNEEILNEYVALQQKIISNTIPYLKKDGYFLYITCSVFKKENEENVAFIQRQFNLQLIKQEVLIGYDKKADSMFAALFKKE